MTKIIELVGLPGAGKSTVVNKVIGGVNTYSVRTDIVEWWNEANVLVRTKVILLFLKASLYFLWYYLFRKKSISVGRRMLWINLFYAKLAVFLVEKKVDCLLMDQLFVQDAWSLAVDGEEECDFCHYHIKKLCDEHEYFVIYLDVSPDVAADRVLNRSGGTSRFDKMLRNDVLESLIIQKKKFDKVLASYADSVLLVKFLADDFSGVIGFIMSTCTQEFKR